MYNRILILLALMMGLHACTPTPQAPIQACTEEAKICPDGSAVGRTGANCAFAPCPTPH